jgi:hypothetical protein
MSSTCLQEKLQAENKIKKMAQKTVDLQKTCTSIDTSNDLPQLYSEDTPNTEHRHRPNAEIRSTSPLLSSALLPTRIATVVEGTVQVAVMPGDGHCLFSALLYQLNKSTPGSPSHKESIHHMRANVVDYIKLQLQGPEKGIENSTVVIKNKVLG